MEKTAIKLEVKPLQQNHIEKSETTVFTVGKQTEMFIGLLIGLDDLITRYIEVKTLFSGGNDYEYCEKAVEASQELNKLFSNELLENVLNNIRTHNQTEI